jgi:hypothetical protein
VLDYYWENPIDEQEIVKSLKRGFVIFDNRFTPDMTEEMRKSYPTFRKWDYQLYQNGNCIGYTTPEVIQSLLDQGIIKTDGKSFVTVEHAAV